VEAIFSPRYLVAAKCSGASWWYVLWRLTPTGEWRYALFEYLSGPNVIRFHSRVGIVRKVGHMDNMEWYLVLEEVVLEDQDRAAFFIGLCTIL